MSERSSGRGSSDRNEDADERARRGAADVDPLELIEGLQAQIDDLTRAVERHQQILEQLTGSQPTRNGE